MRAEDVIDTLNVHAGDTPGYDRKLFDVSGCGGRETRNGRPETFPIQASFRYFRFFRKPEKSGDIGGFPMFPGGSRSNQKA